MGTQGLVYQMLLRATDESTGMVLEPDGSVYELHTFAQAGPVLEVE